MQRLNNFEHKILNDPKLLKTLLKKAKVKNWRTLGYKLDIMSTAFHASRAIGEVILLSDDPGLLQQDRCVLH